MKLKTGIFILAGGRGSRLKSDCPKPLYPILGYPALFYVLDSVKSFSLPVYVISSEAVFRQGSNLFPAVTFLHQKDGGYGTAWALKSAIDEISLFDRVLVLQADDILIDSQFLKKLLATQADYSHAISGKWIDQSLNSDMLECKNERLLRIGNTGRLLNIGRYLFSTADLIKSLNQLQPHKGEYLLTEAINIICQQNPAFKVVIDEDNFINMNTISSVLEAEKILSSRINTTHIKNGVYIEYPELTKISPRTEIEIDVRIEGIVNLRGESKIKKNCTIISSTLINSSIESGSRIENSKIENSIIGNSTNILFSQVKDAIIKTSVEIGPFTHIRPGTILGDKVQIGNFCEIKKTQIEANSKVKHLSYLGDAQLGQNVNIGCGTITANYDGKKKFSTFIRNNVFVGCNTTLIAPVELGDHSFIAAGSTITNDVPPEVLAFGRSRQVNKIGRANNS